MQPYIFFWLTIFFFCLQIFYFSKTFSHISYLTFLDMYVLSKQNSTSVAISISKDTAIFLVLAQVTRNSKTVHFATLISNRSKICVLFAPCLFPWQIVAQLQGKSSYIVRCIVPTSEKCKNKVLDEQGIKLQFSVLTFFSKGPFFSFLWLCCLEIKSLEQKMAVFAKSCES